MHSTLVGLPILMSCQECSPVQFLVEWPRMSSCAYISFRNLLHTWILKPHGSFQVCLPALYKVTWQCRGDCYFPKFCYSLLKSITQSSLFLSSSLVRTIWLQLPGEKSWKSPSPSQLPEVVFSIPWFGPWPFHYVVSLSAYSRWGLHLPRWQGLIQQGMYFFTGEPRKVGHGLLPASLSLLL